MQVSIGIVAISRGGRSLNLRRTTATIRTNAFMLEPPSERLMRFRRETCATLCKNTCSLFSYLLQSVRWWKMAQ